MSTLFPTLSLSSQKGKNIMSWQLIFICVLIAALAVSYLVFLSYPVIQKWYQNVQAERKKMESERLMRSVAYHKPARFCMNRHVDLTDVKDIKDLEPGERVILNAQNSGFENGVWLIDPVSLSWMRDKDFASHDMCIVGDIVEAENQLMMLQVVDTKPQSECQEHEIPVHLQFVSIRSLCFGKEEDIGHIEFDGISLRTTKDSKPNHQDRKDLGKYEYQHTTQAKPNKMNLHSILVRRDSIPNQDTETTWILHVRVRPREKKDWLVYYRFEVLFSSQKESPKVCILHKDIFRSHKASHVTLQLIEPTNGWWSTQERYELYTKLECDVPTTVHYQLCPPKK
jgi:hypothetical protein